MTKRAVVLAVVLAIGAAVAFLAGGRSDKRVAGLVSPAPVPTSPPPRQEGCELPAAKPSPEWLAQFPLPAGSYTMEVLDQAGVQRALVMAKATLDEFVVFVGKEWPKRGWMLGPGEREPYEAENVFQQGQRYGLFRARLTCDPAWSTVLVAVAERQPSPSPT